MVFDITVITYVGDDSWVEQALLDAKACLMSEGLPEANAECDYCNYRSAAKEVEK